VSARLLHTVSDKMQRVTELLFTAASGWRHRGHWVSLQSVVAPWSRAWLTALF